MFVSLQKKCIKPLYRFARSINSQYVAIKECDGTREIILSHVKTRNALSNDMLENLIEAINYKKDEKSLRAIVLSAKSHIFCAGHDLKELAKADINEHKVVFAKATELMQSIVKSPVPVIAKVNGIATAAGCQLVASCDMIVCSDTSKFATPGANVGIFCSTPGIALARCIPKSKALYMLFTGELISAQEAYQYGLVNKVVPADDLDNEVDNIIAKIKSKSRSVVALGKEFYYKQIDMSFSEAYDKGTDVMVKCLNTKDGQEGLKSFIEKRPPNWSHE